eukprot:TRINITY_DN8269_c0_g1_i1.p1 TRINITY_DN8269_c0_g1~~TRINITY_DN8269_c0_g1_i1.p1  ORF type:complete len:606 (+),score=116.69 TRINITY_DN8269_c0_g1_i1:87-1904(+)
MQTTDIKMTNPNPTISTSPGDIPPADEILTFLSSESIAVRLEYEYILGTTLMEDVSQNTTTSSTTTSSSSHAQEALRVFEKILEKEMDMPLSSIATRNPSQTYSGPSSFSSNALANLLASGNHDPHRQTLTANTFLAQSNSNNQVVQDETEKIKHIKIKSCNNCAAIKIGYLNALRLGIQEKKRSQDRTLDNAQELKEQNVLAGDIVAYYRLGLKLDAKDELTVGNMGRFLFYEALVKDKQAHAAFQANDLTSAVGSFDESANQFAALLDLVPTNHNARFNLANALFSAAQVATESLPENEVYDFQRVRCEKAYQTLEQLLCFSDLPSHLQGDTYLLWGEILKMQGTWLRSRAPAEGKVMRSGDKLHYGTVGPNIASRMAKYHEATSGGSLTSSSVVQKLRMSMSSLNPFGVPATAQPALKPFPFEPEKLFIEAANKLNKSLAVAPSNYTTLVISDCLSEMRNASRRVYGKARYFKMGHAMKQGATVRNWKNRFLVLDDTSFSYWKDLNEWEAGPVAGIPNKPQGSISVNAITELILHNPNHPIKLPKPFGFHISTAKRVYHICTSEKQDAEEWVQTIQLVRDLNRAIEASVEAVKPHKTFAKSI